MRVGGKVGGMWDVEEKGFFFFFLGVTYSQKRGYTS